MNTDRRTTLKAVNIAVLGPSSERLAIEVEHRTQTAPQNCKAHIGHENRDKSAQAVSNRHREASADGSLP
jgi:hypothetical protein